MLIIVSKYRYKIFSHGYDQSALNLPSSILKILSIPKSISNEEMHSTSKVLVLVIFR